MFRASTGRKMLDPKTRLRYTWDDSVRVGVQGDGCARLCSSVCIVGGRIDRWEVWGRTPVYGAISHVSWLRGCRIAWLRNSPRLRFMMSGLRRRLSSTGRMRSIPIRTTRWPMSRCATSKGQAGYGFVFTIGRGTEIEVAAIRAVEPSCSAWKWTQCSLTWARSRAAPAPRQPPALAGTGKGRGTHGDRRGDQRRLGSLCATR